MRRYIILFLASGFILGNSVLGRDDPLDWDRQVVRESVASPRVQDAKKAAAQNKLVSDIVSDLGLARQGNQTESRMEHVQDLLDALSYKCQTNGFCVVKGINLDALKAKVSAGRLEDVSETLSQNWSR